MRRFLAALAAMLVTLSPAALAAQQPYERGVVREVNSIRDNNARFGPCVDRFAERRARALADADTLVHLGVLQVARRCNGVMVGEVLARGAIRPATVVDLWMLSPAHRRVITRESYRRIGVGSVKRHGQWTTVAIFIRH